ncbi:MAG: hypothetical protein AAGN64_11710 [Bacteroidota bacterium]
MKASDFLTVERAAQVLVHFCQKTNQPIPQPRHAGYLAQRLSAQGRPEQGYPASTFNSWCEIVSERDWRRFMNVACRLWHDRQQLDLFKTQQS